MLVCDASVVAGGEEGRYDGLKMESAFGGRGTGAIANGSTPTEMPGLTIGWTQISSRRFFGS